MTSLTAVSLASDYKQSTDLKLGIGESFGRWVDGVVPYVYNPTDAPAEFSDNNYFLTQLQAAMDEIEGVSGLTFDYQGVDANAGITDYTDGVVAVGWEQLGGAAGQAGPRSSCTGQDVVDIGYCQYVDGHARFNFDTDWDTGVADFTERGFRQVAVHELLHLVGIGHSEKQVSVMYADPYTNLHHLRADDIDALQSLYGPPDSMTQAPIYIPPAGGASPLADLFVSTNLDIGTAITEIDGSEVAEWAGISWKAQAPFTDDVTLIVTDPHGYYYSGNLDDRDCGGGICTYWLSIGTMETLYTFPGVWTVYAIVGGQLVETTTVTVTTTPTFNQAPDSSFFADVTYGPAPLTVNMTLTVSGDNEGDAVSASWHIPTVGETELDSGSFPGSAGTSARSVPFDSPGEYEIYTTVNDDWDRYGDPQFGTAAGPGFRNLYRTVVRVTEVSDDISAMQDVTGDGVPDMATHIGVSTGRPKVRVFSGADGGKSDRILFLSDNWRGVAISTVRDTNQDGTANDPAVAMLADHKTLQKLSVEIRDVDTGSKIKKLSFRSANWRAVDVVVIDDLDGDGDTDDTAIAVLAQHKTNGKIRVEIKMLADGSPVTVIKFANNKWNAVAAAVLDRSEKRAGTISPLVGVLLEHRTNGKRRIESRRVSSGSLFNKIDIFDSKWDVRDITVNHDLNGDGALTDAGWQVLAIRNTDDQVRVKTALVSNGSTHSKWDILSSNWEGHRLDSMLDANSNSFSEFLVAATKRTNGDRRVQIRDSGSGKVITNIEP